MTIQHTDTAAQAALIDGAASLAARRAWRLRPVVGYTHDDALQDARIGVWQALAQPCAPDERDGLLVLAGYRNILDARKSRWLSGRGGARECDLDDAPEPSAPCTADELLAVAGALAAMERMRDPLPHIAERLIEGDDAAEIAASLGMHESRVSKLRGELRAVVARALDFRGDIRT